ncbi:MAG: nitrite/sulfite reductase, partial [Oceanococcaceae bacterium]
QNLPAAWVQHNVKPHRDADWSSVVVSLKPRGEAPGDATAAQMRRVAELADRFGCGEVRVSHEQNLVLPDVPTAYLPAVHAALAELNLATANAGLASDMICCPGLDFCSLANAGSIDVANDLQELFADADLDELVGPLRLNLSGCMNGCGHHSVGHIGILGVDKKGEEWYQLTLGGNSRNDPRLGDRLGAALSRDAVAPAVTRMLQAYLALREPQETFLQTYDRVGLGPFKEAAYVTDH